MIFARWPLLLFGDGFVAGQTALRILAGCQLFNAAAGPVGVLLVSGGHGRVMAWALGSAVVVNLVLNAVLIPPLGMAGAALATGTSTIVWNGLLIVHVLRRLGIDPTVLGRSMTGK
jgi:O-antigen/teichoic acid export membrane protein